MARLKLVLPATFSFSTTITVLISNINYGGHVGNDSILSFIHEARLRYFQFLGADELNFFGTSVIMGDVVISYKAESFHGDELTLAVTADEFTTYGFDLYYRITKQQAGEQKLVAEAKTGMVCFNYTTRKVEPVPEVFKLKTREAKI